MDTCTYDAISDEFEAENPHLDVLLTAARVRTAAGLWEELSTRAYARAAKQFPIGPDTPTRTNEAGEEVNMSREAMLARVQGFVQGVNDVITGDARAHPRHRHDPWRPSTLRSLVIRERTYTLTLDNGRPLKVSAPDLDVAVYRAERAGFKILNPRRKERPK